MNDSQWEIWQDRNPGGWQETIIDGGGIGDTSVYDTWAAYDAGSPSGSYSNSSSPSFVQSFGKNFLDAYKNQKFGASSSGDFNQAAISGGGGGGHQVTPLGAKSRTKLIGYHHKDPIVVPGGPGTPGRPGIGERALDAGISAGMGLLFGCDERIKVDIAPLESTEVNDALAEVAFFVKGLRECA
jgi:hypothetical protein